MAVGPERPNKGLGAGAFADAEIPAPAPAGRRNRMRNPGAGPEVDSQTGWTESAATAALAEAEGLTETAVEAACTSRATSGTRATLRGTVAEVAPLAPPDDRRTLPAPAGRRLA